MKSTQLHIDPEIERMSISWDQRFFRWLSRILPLRLYYQLPYGRRSLETQLVERGSFPVQEWEERGFAVMQVTPILEVIATELQLPNANLLPGDSLPIVMTPGYDDFTLAWLHHGLCHRIGVVIPIEELRGLISDGSSTVESLVRQLLHTVSDAQDL